jgi:hypothetical protein
MVVWSYGGGKQSVAIAALIVQGKLPKPDLIVMADTDANGHLLGATWATGFNQFLASTE